MTQKIVEGFGTYGLGGTSLVKQNLLSGVYAELPNYATIGQLPWAAADKDLFLSCVSGAGPLRRVLPATQNVTIVSMYYACEALTATDTVVGVVDFRDDTNTIIAQLVCRSTGVLSLYGNSRTSPALGSTQGPVIVAQTAMHLEMEINVSAGTFVLNAAAAGAGGVEPQVLNLSGLALGAKPVAQIGFLYFVGYGDITSYAANLIIRDNLGTANNSIVGDRRVATLFVNSDDPTHQGWTGEPLKRFGTGVLNNTGDLVGGYADNGGVSCASSPQTDLGSGDFTIEGNFRFRSLPTASNIATLFGKWSESDNQRSYQLYVGGPTLENGNTVFRISTDGQTDTLAELISWPFVWEVGTWYHVAIVRASGETMLFIDGQQQGLPVADAHVYFAGTGASSLGVQVNSTGALANTALLGWQDEFRLTVGVARYTANFAPPTAAFPRGSVNDPYWADVAWLSGWDSGLFDDGPDGRALSAQNGAFAETPDDGVSNFQTMNKNAVPPPLDDTFVEAALLNATGVLTQSALPVAANTVTVATKDGTTAAVYTWRAAVAAAFDVLIGATVAASISNLQAAINAGAGAGTNYGTGTTANHDVTASILPSGQLEATAITAGAAGNALASTTTDPSGSWSGTTLSGGADIPPYSQFGLQAPPPDTTLIDSLTIMQRTFKTDAGPAAVQASLVGPAGTAAAGATLNVSTVPTYYFDTFETDPDTGASITPTTVLGAKIRINRTA